MRVAILHSGNPRNDFRLKRTLTLLVELGHQPVVFSFLTDEKFGISDWPGCDASVLHPLTKIQASKNPIWLLRVLYNLTVTRFLERRYIKEYPDSVTGLSKQVFSSGKKFDLLWSINLETMAETKFLAEKLGLPYVYEAYENFHALLSNNAFYSDQLKNKEMVELENCFTQAADAVVVVSKTIADEYIQAYDIKPPVVVYNVPQCNPVKPCPVMGPIKFYFQSYLRPSYCIEEVIEAFESITGDASLTLQGAFYDADFHVRLVERIKLSPRANDIYLLDACDFEKTVQEANKYDIGISPHADFGRYPVSKNLIDALPNKYFTYIYSGLAVIAPQGTQQVDFAEGKGFIKAFNPKSVESLGRSMQWCCDNPREVMTMKDAAYNFSNKNVALSNTNTVAAMIDRIAQRSEE